MDRKRLRPILSSIVEATTKVSRRRLFATRATRLRQLWARWCTAEGAFRPLTSTPMALTADPSSEARNLDHEALPGEVVPSVPSGDEPAAHLRSTSVISRIPIPSIDFVGRERELQELRDNFAMGVYIVGAAGGVGATALACRLAHELAHRFPGGSVAIDLRGVTSAGDAPATPAELQRLVLMLLAPTEVLPEDPSALNRLYHRILAERPALLLLDDASGVSQLRHLLPRKSSAAIVTSATPLPSGWEKLYPLTLEGLPFEDARVLLEKLAPTTAREPRRVLERVLSRLKGNPLAIRLLAALLGDGKGALRRLERPLLGSWRRTVALRGAGAAGLEVAAVLELAYERLSAGAQARFASLGVFNGAFSPVGAAAVWQSHVQVAEPWLAELVSASLVTSRPETHTYLLHPMIRQYAQELLLSQPQLSQSVLRQYAAYVLRLASHLAGRCRNHRELGSYEGLSCSELLIHLQTAWIRVTGREPGWPTVADGERWIRDLPLRAMPALRTLLPRRELLGWVERASEAARSLGDQRAEAVFLGILGHINYKAGDYALALMLVERQLQLVRDRGDRRTQADVLVNLGRVLHALHAEERARLCWAEALGLLEAMDDPRTERMRAYLHSTAAGKE